MITQIRKRACAFACTRVHTHTNIRKFITTMARIRKIIKHQCLLCRVQTYNDVEVSSCQGNIILLSRSFCFEKVARCISLSQEIDCMISPLNGLKI